MEMLPEDLLLGNIFASSILEMLCVSRSYRSIALASAKNHQGVSKLLHRAKYEAVRVVLNEHRLSSSFGTTPAFKDTVFESLTPFRCFSCKRSTYSDDWEETRVGNVWKELCAADWRMDVTNAVRIGSVLFSMTVCNQCIARMKIEVLDMFCFYRVAGVPS